MIKKYIYEQEQSDETFSAIFQYLSVLDARCYRHLFVSIQIHLQLCLYMLKWGITW